MGQQQFVSCSNKKRGFSSASSIGGSGAIRVSKAPMGQPVMATCMHGGGNTSQSFHNFGQMNRISCCADHHRRNYVDTDLSMGCVVGHSALANAFGFGSHVARGRSDGIREIYTNKHLLEPLYLGVDPHDHQVKAHEKDQLKDLNNQFAGFIDKVRFLEQRNQMLVTKWELLQSQTVPTVRKDLKPLCENFITNLRKKLDCLLCEKNKLENQHKTMQDLIEENRHKYENEVNRRAHAENDFVLLKKEVDDAFKQQKELELKKELQIENINFLKNFFAQELAVLDCRLCDTSVVVNMNNNRFLDMDALIQNVESWYQAVAQRSKEEANLFYWNQIEDLQKKRCEFHDNLKKSLNEITELNRVIQIMRCQVESEKKKVAFLQSALRDTEEHGDSALKDAQAKQKDLQKNLQGSKDKLASLLRDYHDLMNTKLALDIEIATYKTMLEGEENRIYTGAPVSLAVMNTTTCAIHNKVHNVNKIV
ncbi:keratin, type II cytoskeletal 5-like [Elgaria multicarinata webbii]|uniref:keratin, type II cytoskeletal 5-like n=1 Tax=Elgaria multicarinata webbii TaxID=159646 RepID=UPI002FCD22A8